MDGSIPEPEVSILQMDIKLHVLILANQLP